MKYLDYNLLSLDFTQNATGTFETEPYTKIELDAILSRMKKLNIIVAKVTEQNGNSFVRVGCVNGYDNRGYPIFSFTENNLTFTLYIVAVGDKFIFTMAVS